MEFATLISIIQQDICDLDSHELMFNGPTVKNATSAIMSLIRKSPD